MTFPINIESLIDGRVVESDRIEFKKIGGQKGGQKSGQKGGQKGGQINNIILIISNLN